MADRASGVECVAVGVDDDRCDASLGRCRLDQGGNRQINAVLHRMAVTQLRCNPAAGELYERARRRNHTKREAMRILKRHLSNVVYRTMLRDALKHSQNGLLQQAA